MIFALGGWTWLGEFWGISNVVFAVGTQGKALLGHTRCVTTVPIYNACV